MVGVAAMLFREGRSFARHITAMQARGIGAAMSSLLQQPAPPDCKEPDSIVLVTLAGNEYRMPANLAHYEDFEQLEDDVVNFLPTVADVEVFGREVDLIMPDQNCHCKIPSIPP